MWLVYIIRAIELIYWCNLSYINIKIYRIYKYKYIYIYADGQERNIPVATQHSKIATAICFPKNGNEAKLRTIYAWPMSCQ